MEPDAAPPGPPRSLKVFAVLGILYYLFYLAVFASRVGDYWKDVLRHFPWARGWLGG